MAARTFIYYTTDGRELTSPHGCLSLREWQRFMPDVEAPKWQKLWGFVFGYISNERLPVARIVAFKTKNPSLHKCDARCQSATGPNCECSCNGKNHGIAA